MKETDIDGLKMLVDFYKYMFKCTDDIKVKKYALKRFKIYKKVLLNYGNDNKKFK